MGKARILQLIDNSRSVNGFANIIAISENIDKEKFDISIASCKDEIVESASKNAGAKYIPVKISDNLRSKYVKEILSLVQSENFSLIHSHGHSAGIYSRSVKKRLETLKCVHSLHGIQYQKHRNFLRKGLDRTVDQYLSQFTDMTICETHDEYLVAVKNKIAFRNRTEVIPACINIGDFANKKRNDKLRSLYGIGPENFVIGCISEFNEFSNQKLIIQAAYFLIRKYPQMRFVLSGSGSFLNQMKDLARESNIDEYIIFTGNRSADEDFFTVFDVFAYPFAGNQLPVVLLEAMASGLPVICSHNSAILEIIKPNYSALTIRPDDMDDLFQKVSVLYQDPELRERISQNALIESTQYDVSEIVPKIQQLYEEVLSL